MIPDTFLYYVVIRVSIWILRLVAPAAAVYCLARSLGYIHISRIFLALDIVASLELVFYIFVSFPRQWTLNQSRPKTIHRTREERQALFERCWATIPDLEKFLSVWFQGANPARIHRENFKDFLAWCFFYETRASSVDNDELDAYVQRTENELGWTFLPERGTSRPMQVSTDTLRLQHKPLIFYVFAMGADDFMTYLTARWMGLNHFRLPLRNFFSVFPFRPYTLCTRYVSPSNHLSYWYRPHTSKTRKPLLFIHGIGAGLRTYTGILHDFIKQDNLKDDDGEVGIIAIELMAISMRITRGILPRAEMVREILKILDYHQWDDFVTMGHSYGSIIATHLLQELRDTNRVGPLLLVDPVTLSIQWGDVPYNFIYRRPRKASEWQLHYFASTEMGVAHAITRRFDWTENVLWKDDMRGRLITVVLVDRDIIMDTAAIRHYLVDDDDLGARVHNARELSQEVNPRHHRGGHEGDLEIYWYDGLNHAGVFDRAKDWIHLVNVLHRYCGTER